MKIGVNFSVPARSLRGSLRASFRPGPQFRYLRAISMSDKPPLDYELDACCHKERCLHESRRLGCWAYNHLGILKQMIFQRWLVTMLHTELGCKDYTLISFLNQEICTWTNFACSTVTLSRYCPPPGLVESFKPPQKHRCFLAQPVTHFTLESIEQVT